MDETLGGAMDFVLINEAGKETKRFLPPVLSQPLRIGRETDNDVILADPRVSRYHAQIRRGTSGIEVMDVGSANGISIGAKRLEANVWHPVPADAVVYLGDTTFVYRPRLDQAPTLSMTPVVQRAEAGGVAVSADGSKGQHPWLIIGAGVALLVVVIALAVLLWPSGEDSGELASGPGITPTAAVAEEPGEPPRTQPEEEGEMPFVPYPVISVSSVVVEPIILGALPDISQAFIIVRVRVENQGSGDFSLSADQFQLLDSTGDVLKEIGGTYSEEGLRKLGVADRFQNLRLKPGDSVAQSLLFSGDARLYQFYLRYEAPGLQPITLNLGPVDVSRELAIVLGTPTPEGATAVAMAPATLTSAPTETPTRPAAIPRPKTVPVSSLKGSIAYPVFNGETYDLYLGNSDGSGTSFFLSGASQPAFSADGNRIAYHSWSSDKRGLVTADVAGGNEHIIAVNLEDQLPTWSPDGDEVIFLSRRSGQRASELYIVSSVGGEAQIIGNGEYPTWGASGELAFKGWESTGVGLRLSAPDLSDMVELTGDETDTAPAVSPDGEWIAFMSKRDNNWDIYLVDKEGENLRRLTDDPAEDGLPTWSPDGKVIAFVSNRGGPWSVWATTPTAENGGKRQLFTMEGSPDGFVAGEDLDKSRGWAEERISWTY
jgi:pSer/pThr/pTyr-binding forkhead associated (FHA) protein